jgi:hypothetical protein
VVDAAVVGAATGEGAAAAAAGTGVVVAAGAERRQRRCCWVMGNKLCSSGVSDGSLARPVLGLDRVCSGPCTLDFQAFQEVAFVP